MTLDEKFPLLKLLDIQNVEYLKYYSEEEKITKVEDFFSNNNAKSQLNTIGLFSNLDSSSSMCDVYKEILNFIKPTKVIDEKGIGIQFNFDAGLPAFDLCLAKIISKDFVVVNHNLYLYNQYKQQAVLDVFTKTHRINFFDFEKYTKLGVLYKNSTRIQREKLYEYMIILHKRVVGKYWNTDTTNYELKNVINYFSNVFNMTASDVTKFFIITKFSLEELNKLRCIKRELLFGKKDCILLNYMDILNEEKNCLYIYMDNRAFGKMNLGLMESQIRYYLYSHELEFLFTCLADLLKKFSYSLDKSDYTYLMNCVIMRALSDESVIKSISLGKVNNKKNVIKVMLKPKDCLWFMED